MLFGISLALMLFAVVTPQFWMTAIALGVVIFAASCRKANDPAGTHVPTERRWQVELCSLLAAPGILVLLYEACELFCWGCDSTSSGPTVYWSQMPRCDGLMPVAECVPYVQWVIAAWLVWRHRARLWRTAAVAVLAVCWSIGARMATDMAISGNWL
jgi:hypothetical protein